MSYKILLILLSLSCSLQLTAQVYRSNQPLAHTYSIVARDEQTGELGVGVQSHWFSVGTAVSWAEAGSGAIATQSFVNKSFGPRGLEMLRQGMNARAVMDALLKEDEAREVRQLAIVDRDGNVATHTGNSCIQFAAHITGHQFSVQSNMMLTDKVNQSMADAFKKSLGKPLAERILLSLEAAQLAGGDIRGQQSAALLVVPAETEGKPWDERSVDLRVDDAAQPLKELRRLLKVHTAYAHMNNGDLAIEHQDMEKAMKEYSAAMKLMPDNIEMQYWTAITLANNKELNKALPIFKKVFTLDKNWRELTKRLPEAKLLTVSEADFKKIIAL